MTPGLLAYHRYFVACVLIAGTCICCFTTLPPSASASSFEATLESVVSVLPTWPPQIRRLEEPEGSGVIIRDGRTVITARHVVDKALQIRVRTRAGKILRAELIGGDPATDIAVLRIAEALTPLEVITEAPRLGDRVCSAGNAFGLGLSLTCGSVSGLNRSGIGFNPIEDFIQTDAAINPGVSGGALINDKGEFIGLVSAIFTKKSDANIGVNFAVSGELLNRVIPDLVERGRVDWPKFGFRATNFPSKEGLGVMGAQIRFINQNSAAERAGLSVGDVVLFAGERRVRTASDLISAIALQSRGSQLKLEITRNKQRTKLEYKVE